MAGANIYAAKLHASPAPTADDRMETAAFTCAGMRSDQRRGLMTRQTQANKSKCGDKGQSQGINSYWSTSRPTTASPSGIHDLPHLRTHIHTDYTANAELKLDLKTKYYPHFVRITFEKGAMQLISPALVWPEEANRSRAFFFRMTLPPIRKADSRARVSPSQRV